MFNDYRHKHTNTHTQRESIDTSNYDRFFFEESERFRKKLKAHKQKT